MLVRRLYRISAILDERYLHPTLLAFTQAKAMNVEVAPVTTGGELIASETPRPNSRSTIYERMLEIINAASGGEVTIRDLQTALPDVMPKSVAQTAFHLVKDKQITRAKRGIFIARKAGSAAKAEAKPPKKVKTAKAPKATTSPKPPRKMTPAGPVAAYAATAIQLLQAAPDHKMKVKDVFAAMKPQHQEIDYKAVSNLMIRLVNRDKNVKRVENGTYQYVGE